MLKYYSKTPIIRTEHWAVLAVHSMYCRTGISTGTYNRNFRVTPIVSRSKSKWYKAQKVQKCAINSNLQALQILTINDEVENLNLSSFLLAAKMSYQILYVI